MFQPGKTTGEAELQLNDANLQTGKTTKKGKGRTKAAADVAGRKGTDKQEQVISTEPVKEKIKHLETLKKKADSAKVEYNDAVKAVAKESGFMSTVVRALVEARANNAFKDSQRKADQLSLIFEEVGA